MTKKELVLKMLESLQSAIDNDADNLHDMGWDERLDNLEMDREDLTDETLDSAYDAALFMVTTAIEEAVKQCKE